MKRLRFGFVVAVLAAAIAVLTPVAPQAAAQSWDCEFDELAVYFLNAERTEQGYIDALTSIGGTYGPDCQYVVSQVYGTVYATWLSNEYWLCYAFGISCDWEAMLIWWAEWAAAMHTGGGGE